MADVAVTLQNKKITVDKQKVSVSVSKGDRVTWTCDQGEFQVSFKPGSNWPNPNTRQVGSIWQAQSGPFNNPNTQLFYSVSASGYGTLDPEVDVVP